MNYRRGRVSLRPILSDVNQAAGQVMNNIFYNACGIPRLFQQKDFRFLLGTAGRK